MTGPWLCLGFPHSRAGEVAVSQSHSWEQGGFSPGSRPGSSPWLCAAPSPLSGARTRSRDAFDAGAKAEVVTWMFLYEIPGGKQPIAFPFRRGREAAQPSPGEGSQAGAVPPACWATLGKLLCLSMPQFPHL